MRLPSARSAKTEDVRTFFANLLSVVRQLPGITSATLGTPPPRHPATSLVPEGAEDAPEDQPRTLALLAGEDYFQTLGIDIVAGRPFSADDREGSTPVAIVDEEAARRFWGGASAIGRRIRAGGPGRPWLAVVGVARDVKTASIGYARDSLEVYTPLSQADRPLRLSLLYRAENTLAMLAPIQSIAQALEPAVRFELAGPVAELYGHELVNPRFTALRPESAVWHRAV